MIIEIICVWLIFKEKTFEVNEIEERKCEEKMKKSWRSGEEKGGLIALLRLFHQMFGMEAQMILNE